MLILRFSIWTCSVLRIPPSSFGLQLVPNLCWFTRLRHLRPNQVLRWQELVRIHQVSCELKLTFFWILFLDRQKKTCQTFRTPKLQSFFFSCSYQTATATDVFSKTPSTLDQALFASCTNGQAPQGRGRGPRPQPRLWQRPCPVPALAGDGADWIPGGRQDHLAELYPQGPAGLWYGNCWLFCHILHYFAIFLPYVAIE